MSIGMPDNKNLQVAGVILDGFLKASIKLNIIAATQAATIENIDPVQWYPLQRLLDLQQFVQDNYKQAGPIFEKIGQSMITTWYHLGPGKELIRTGADFLHFQSGSRGYRSVVAGPEDFVGDFSLIEIDEIKGLAKIHSTTPFNRDLEKGLILGGMSAPGDLDYVQVSNGEDQDHFVIRFHKEHSKTISALIMGECFPEGLKIDAKTVEGIYWKYKAASLELQRERAFWSALNETIESAYEALHNSEQRMKLHLMLTPLGGIEWDKECRVVQWNPAAEKIFGYVRDEALGCHASFLVPESGKDNVCNTWDALLQKRGATKSTNENITKDNRVIYCEWYNTPLVDPRGSVSGIVSLVEDVTDRIQAEVALLESERKYRNLVDHALIGIYTTNIEGDFLYANQALADIFEFEYAEKIMSQPVSLRYKNIRDREMFIEALRKSGSVDSYEVEVITAKGKTRDVIISAVLDQDTISGMILDITDRKRAEEERLEMERRLLHTQKLESLGILAGGIAHDFNNLLMTIMGNLDLALMKLPPPSPVRENIEHALQAAQRSANLTGQMLAYSGKGMFIVKKMNLSELVEDIAHLLRTTITKSSTLRLNLQKKIPDIDADPGQIQQIIMNLITNASEAIGESTGVITLSTYVRDCDEEYLSHSRLDKKPLPGRFVCLEVSDTGSGMDANTMQLLFDPFFTTKTMGRGLGMSAMLGIMRSHRGAIVVDSVLGLGSTITVLFPAVVKSEDINGPAKSEDAGVETEHLAAQHRGTVLLVDDEELVLVVCKEMLVNLGFSALTAENGLEAVEIIKKQAADIDCVILDLSMPKMDGLAAFREIIRIKPDAKVILSSGYNEQDASSRFPDKKLAGFIQKPYTLNNLRSALDRVLK
jgi:PAS domain S-box-containing protein